MRTAVGSGNLDVVKYLREKNCDWDSTACSEAAEKGYLDILKWLHENGCHWDYFSLKGAAEHGHLKILQYLVENHCKFNNVFPLMESAVKGGNLELIKWLRTKLTISLETSLCSIASDCEHWDVVLWLIKNGCVPRKNVMHEALRTQSLEALLEIYHSNGAFGQDWKMLNAVGANGRKDFVEWLSKKLDRNKLDYFYECWSQVFMGACSENHLDIMKIALRNYLVCYEEFSDWNNYPIMCKWLK